MPNIVANVAVIGGGPAGYSAALRASKLGANVTLVEKSRLGGACLNHACIPTKTLLHSLAILQSVNHTSHFGINTSPATNDIEALRQRKNAVISIMTSGVGQLMDQSGIKVISGNARLHPSTNIEITKVDGVEILKADKIIIATGSIPCRLNVPGGEDSAILCSSDVLDLRHVPQSIVMVGGGAVGVELSVILNRLGTRVTILEIMPSILPCEDAEVTQIFERSLKKDGIQIYTGAQIDRIETFQEGKRIQYQCGETLNTLAAEAVCVTIGQKPFVEGLGLTDCAVKTGMGGIEVDDHMLTSVPGIFAAGDVTGNSMLAYVAMAEGRVAAENALGIDSEMNYSAVPRCVYASSLELASVGLTEIEARSRGLNIRCLRSKMAANASAAILGERRGMVKVIATENSGVVLGVHIIGTGASNLIAECALAVKLGATAKDLAQTIHLHPSLSETIWEAVLGNP
jgi:dihydrolipoamide dehydrogenase